MTGALKRDGNGVPQRLLLTLRDVTAQRRLDAQLVEAQRMDALGRLAGGIAHDFNNLLAVIVAATDLLTRRLRQQPTELADVRTIRETAERAALLTRDLLAFARQERTPATAVVVDELLARTHAMLVRLLGPGIELVVDDDAAGAEVVIAPSHLGQVLVNLVVNARDAMPDGGRVVVETRRRTVEPGGNGEPADVAPGDYVELRVSDTGQGIPDDVRARIFEPFFTTKPMGRGTGLGLAIVYGIVRQCRGRVAVSATSERGTTFTVLLPLAGTIARAAPAAVETPPARATVLVVEDDDLVRNLTSRVLKAAGFRVLEAASGDAALALWRAHPGEIVLVVSDVAMPGMDGVQTLQALRALRDRLPCVFVTGYARQEGRLQSIPDTVVLQKPFAPTTLLAAVRQLLARSTELPAG